MATTIDYATIQIIGVMIAIAVGPVYPILLWLLKVSSCHGERIAKTETENNIYHKEGEP